MKNVSKRVMTLFLSLLLAVFLFASCEEVAEELELVEPETVYTNYQVEEVVLAMTEEEYVLDAGVESDGFWVLIGTPEHLHGTQTTMYNGIPLTYRDVAEERGETTMVNSTIRHYSSDFSSEMGREEPDVKYTRLQDRIEGAEYAYRAHVVSYIYPLMTEHLGKSENVLRGSYYEMFRNGELVFEYFTPSQVDDYTVVNEDGNEIAQGFIPHKAGDAELSPGEKNPVSLRNAQYWVQEDVVYTATRVTGNSETFLFINDRRLPPPSGSTIRGVAEIAGQMYVLTEDHGEKGSMIPLRESTTILDHSGAIALEVPPTGGCGTDGKAAYFLSEGDLYRTDGNETYRIAETGLDKGANISRIRPLEDGRILMVSDYQLYLLTPTGEAVS